MKFYLIGRFKLKALILAGGFGTRLSEYTDLIPKPMVEIGGKPILIHIIGLYSRSKHSDFYVALGYKSEVIISYFKSIADEIISENKLDIVGAVIKSPFFPKGIFLV